MPENNQLGGFTFYTSNPNFKVFDLPGVIGGAQGSSYLGIDNFEDDYPYRVDYADDIVFEERNQDIALSNDEVYSTNKQVEEVDSSAYLQVQFGDTAYQYQQSKEKLETKDWSGVRPSYGAPGASVMQAPIIPPKSIVAKASQSEKAMIESGDFEISNKILGKEGISRAKIFSDKKNEKLLEDPFIVGIKDNPNIGYLKGVNRETLQDNISKINEGLKSHYDTLIESYNSGDTPADMIEKELKQSGEKYLAEEYKKIGLIPNYTADAELSKLVDSYKFITGSEPDKIAYLANYANRNNLDPVEFVKSNSDKIYPSLLKTQTKLEAEARLLKAEKEKEKLRFTGGSIEPAEYGSEEAIVTDGESGNISDFNRERRLEDKTIDNYKKIVDDDWNNETPFVKSVSRGFKENREQLLFGTASDIRENLDLSYVLNKKQAGATLSNIEEDYLNSSGLLNYSSSLFPQSRGELVGSSMPLMLNYMIKFALTGGVYSGTKQVVSSATERAMQITATNTIAKFLGNETIKKWAPEVVGTLAGVISQATVGGSPEIVSDAIRQLTPSNLYYFDPSTSSYYDMIVEATETNPFEAAFKAWASQTVEFGTERLGFVFGTKAFSKASESAYNFMFRNAVADAVTKSKLARGLGVTVTQLEKIAKITSDKLGNSYIGRLFMSDIAARHAELIPTAAATQQLGYIKRFLRATGTNNLLAENFEEFVANRIQPFIYSSEDKFWDSPSKAFKTTVNEAVNTTLTMAPIFGASTASTITSRIYSKLSSNEERRLFNVALTALRDYDSQEFSQNIGTVESNIASNIKDRTMKKQLEKLIEIRKRFESQEIGSVAEGQSFSDYLKERNEQSKILFEVQKSFNRSEVVSYSTFSKMISRITDKDIKAQADELYSFYNIYNKVVVGSKDTDKYPTFYRFVSSVNEEYQRVESLISSALDNKTFISLPFIRKRIKSFKYFTIDQRTSLMSLYKQLEDDFKVNKSILYEQQDQDVPSVIELDGGVVSLIMQPDGTWSTNIVGVVGSRNGGVALTEAIIKDMNDGKLSFNLLSKLPSILNNLQGIFAADVLKEQKEFITDSIHKYIVNSLASEQQVTEHNLPAVYQIVDAINSLGEQGLISQNDFDSFLSILEKVLLTGVNTNNANLSAAVDLLSYMFYNSSSEEFINIDKLLELTRKIVPQAGFEEKKIKRPYSKRSVVDRIAKSIKNSKFKAKSSYKDLLNSNESIASLEVELKKLVAYGKISKKTNNFIRSILVRLPSNLIEFNISLDETSNQSFISFNPGSKPTIFIGTKGLKADSVNEKYFVYDLVEELIHSIDFKLGHFAALSLFDESLFNEMTDGSGKIKDVLKAVKTFYHKSDFTKKSFLELKEKVESGNAATEDEVKLFDQLNSILKKFSTSWESKKTIKLGELEEEYNETKVIKNLVRMSQFVNAGYSIDQAYYYASQPQEFLARNIADYLIFGESYAERYKVSSLPIDVSKFFSSVKQMFLKNIISPVFSLFFKNKKLFEYTEESDDTTIRSKILNDLLLQPDDYEIMQTIYSMLSGIETKDVVSFEDTWRGVSVRFGSFKQNYKWDEALSTYKYLNKLDVLLKQFVATNRMDSKVADIVRNAILNNFNLNILSFKDFYVASPNPGFAAGLFLPNSYDIYIKGEQPEDSQDSLKGTSLAKVLLHEITHLYMDLIISYRESLVNSYDFKRNRIVGIIDVEEFGITREMVDSIVKSVHGNFERYQKELLEKVIPRDFDKVEKFFQSTDGGNTIEEKLSTLGDMYYSRLEARGYQYSKKDARSLITYGMYLYLAQKVTGSTSFEHTSYFAADPEELFVESFATLSYLAELEFDNSGSKDFASYFMDKQKAIYAGGIRQILEDGAYEEMLDDIVETGKSIAATSVLPLEIANKSILSFWSKMFGDDIMNLGVYAKAYKTVHGVDYIQSYINAFYYEPESYRDVVDYFSNYKGEKAEDFLATTLAINTMITSGAKHYETKEYFDKYIDYRKKSWEVFELPNKLSSKKGKELLRKNVDVVFGLRNLHDLFGFTAETFEEKDSQILFAGNISTSKETVNVLIKFDFGKNDEEVFKIRYSDIDYTILFSGIPEGVFKYNDKYLSIPVGRYYSTINEESNPYEAFTDAVMMAATVSNEDADKKIKNLITATGVPGRKFGSFKNDGEYNGVDSTEVTRAFVKLSGDTEFISGRSKYFSRLTRTVLHYLNGQSTTKDIMLKAYELYMGGYTPWANRQMLDATIKELSEIEEVEYRQSEQKTYSHLDKLSEQQLTTVQEFLKDFGISEEIAKSVAMNPNSVDVEGGSIESVYRNLRSVLMSSHAASLALSYAGISLISDKNGVVSNISKPTIRSFALSSEAVDISSLYEIFKAKAKRGEDVSYIDIQGMLKDIYENESLNHLFYQYATEIINAWKYYLSLSSKDFKKLLTSNELGNLLRTEYSPTLEGYNKQIDFIHSVISKADYRAVLLEIQSAKRAARARFNSRAKENIKFYAAQRKLATINPKLFFKNELIEIRDMLRHTHITVGNVDNFVTRVEEIYEENRKFSSPLSFAERLVSSINEEQEEMLIEANKRFINNLKVILQERELNQDVQNFLSIDVEPMTLDELKEYVTYLKFVYKNNEIDFNIFEYMMRIEAEKVANSFIESSNRKFVELFNKKAKGGIEQFFTVYGMINAYGLSDALELAQKGMSEESSILTSSILNPLNENYDNQRKILQSILKEIRPAKLMKKKAYRNIAGIIGILSQRPESFKISKSIAEKLSTDYEVDEAVALGLVDLRITEESNPEIYDILRKNFVASKLKDSIKLSFLQDIEGIEEDVIDEMRDDMFAATMRTAKDATKEFNEMKELFEEAPEDWFDKLLDYIIENKSIQNIESVGLVFKKESSQEELMDYVNKIRSVFLKIKNGEYTNSQSIDYVTRVYLGDRLFENINDYVPLLRYKEYNVSQLTVDAVDAGSTVSTMLRGENDSFVSLTGTMMANSKATEKRTNVVMALQTDLYEMTRMRADNELFFMLNQKNLIFLKSLFKTRLFAEKNKVEPLFSSDSKKFLSNQIINYYNRGLTDGNIKLRSNSRKALSLGRMLRVMNGIRVLTLGSLFKAPAQLGSMFNSAQTMGGSLPERMYDIARAVKYSTSDTDGSIDRFIYDYAPDVYFRNIVDYDLDKVGTGLREKLGDLFTDYAGGKGKWTDMQMYSLIYFDRQAAKIAFLANYLNFLRLNNISFDLANPNYEGIQKAADAVKQTQGTENILYKPATITNTANKPFGLSVERGGEWQEFANKSYWAFKTFALFDIKRIRKARVRMADGIEAMADGNGAAGFNMFMSGATEMIANMIAKIMFAYLKAFGETAPIYIAGQIAGGDEWKEVRKMHLSFENILVRSFFDYWVMLEPLQYAIINGTKEAHKRTIDYDEPEDDYKYLPGDITSLGLIQQIWDDANVMIPMAANVAKGESEAAGLDAAVSSLWLTSALLGCYPPMSEMYQISKTARQIEYMKQPSSGVVNTDLNSKLLTE